MISENMKKNVQKYEKKIKPISTELSEDTKKMLEWLEWANEAFHAYATQLFMIR